MGKIHLFFFALLLLLSAGMITGYFDILPHFLRSEKLSLSDSLSNPTNIQSWISSLLPFATVKNDVFYDTDISMRNCYFGITFLLFFMLACIQKKTRWQNFLLVSGVIFALLSSGGIFKTIFYRSIPLIGYIRLNGEFRIFSLLCFIPVAAISLEKYLLQKRGFSGPVKWIYYGIEIILFAFIIYGLYGAFGGKQTALYHVNDIWSEPGMAGKLKRLVDAITFHDTLWIQGSIQMLFLWGIKWCLRNDQQTLLKNITIINIVLAALINIPYTGAGKASVAQVQAVLNKSPKGIPIPPLHPINNNDTISIDEKGLVGNWSMYNKQVGTSERVPYPIILNDMNTYFERDTKKENLQQAFIFLSSFDDKDSLSISYFSPNKITVDVLTGSSKLLILQQNYYPHWYFDNGRKKIQVHKAGFNFMSADVIAGRQQLSFIFEPQFLQWMMILSAVCFFMIVSLIITLTVKPLLTR